MKRIFLISASLMIASGAFAQTNCVTAPVNVTSTPVTITTSGAKSVTKDKAYIYFERKHRRHETPYPAAGINSNYPSTPLMLSWDKKVTSLPETYNVSVTTPQGNVSVCPDSALDVATTINVERVSSYTGNYPNDYSDNKMYEKVSKHKYKMAERKMRKIRRDEAKVSGLSGEPVDVRTDKM